MVLLVIYFVWRENGPPEKLFTDSWALANGLTGQSVAGEEQDWKIIEQVWRELVSGSVGVSKKPWLMSTRECWLQVRH